MGPGNWCTFAIVSDSKALSMLPLPPMEATILTSRVSAPLLSSIFKSLDAPVNVVGVEKDIGCLITIEDIEKLDLTDIKNTVIFPGRAFVHDSEIKEVLNQDGGDRLVRRGPDKLTVDGEMSISMTRDEVIQREIEYLTELIDMVNMLGVPQKGK